MVSVILRKKSIGYIPGPPGKRDIHEMKSHFIFMDDFKGLASTESNLKLLLNTSTEILKEIGLSIGIDKCAVLKVKRGKVVEMDGIDVAACEVIKSIHNESG